MGALNHQVDNEEPTLTANLFEGDILLTPNSGLETWNSRRDQKYRWENGRIPYHISKDFDGMVFENNFPEPDRQTERPTTESFSKTFFCFAFASMHVTCIYSYPEKVWTKRMIKQAFSRLEERTRVGSKPCLTFEEYTPKPGENTNYINIIQGHATASGTYSYSQAFQDLT